MPGKVFKIGTFSDWVGLFYDWRKEVGVDHDDIKNFKFDTLYGAIDSDEIQFGHYKGRPKWETVRQVPTQNMRDALLNMIVYQGDTEFASSEQQRSLLNTAPSAHDHQCLLRVMREEMRHGCQMSHILVNHFGSDGRLEARKLLERRAYEGSRLLGAFNQPVTHWLDFFTYTCFIDRDGKYQLTMLHHSSFAPLSKSMGPMLKEEGFHLFTGQSGLLRVVKAGKIPVEIIQKYLNKRLSTGYDLFGKDRSGSAARFYRWGFKGRFDEAAAGAPPQDLERVNEEARTHYYNEDCEIIKGLNQLIPEGQPKLRAPDVKFNRKIGDYADQTFSVYGEPLSTEDYLKHLEEVLPGPGDLRQLETIFREQNWLAGTGNA